MRDDAPRSSGYRYRGFESGLRRNNGQRKPAYRAFPNPLAELLREVLVEERQCLADGGQQQPPLVLDPGDPVQHKLDEKRVEREGHIEQLRSQLERELQDLHPRQAEALLEDRADDEDGEEAERDVQGFSESFI